MAWSSTNATMSLQGQGQQWVASMTEIVSGLCQVSFFTISRSHEERQRAYLIRRQWIRLIKQITENQCLSSEVRRLSSNLNSTLTRNSCSTAGWSFCSISRSPANGQVSTKKKGVGRERLVTGSACKFSSGLPTVIRNPLLTKRTRVPLALSCWLILLNESFSSLQPVSLSRR